MTFQEWGPAFQIEFDITVKKLSSSSMSIFQFTSLDLTNLNHETSWKKGIRIPALFWDSSKKLHFTMGVNDKINNYYNFAPQINKKYHVVIQQFQKQGTTYTYEVKIDGQQVHGLDNTKAEMFTDVRLYAGNTWDKPWTSEFGTIENFYIIKV